MQQILYLKQNSSDSDATMSDYLRQFELIFLNEYDIICDLIKNDMAASFFDLTKYKVIIIEITDSQCSFSASFISSIISYISSGGNIFLFNFSDGSFHNYELSLIQGGTNGKRMPLTIADFQKAQDNHRIVLETMKFTLEEAPADLHRDPFVDLSILLECAYGNSIFPILWYRNYYGGRVLSLSLGNPQASLQNSEIVKIIRRTIFWLFDMI